MMDSAAQSPGRGGRFQGRDIARLVAGTILFAPVTPPATAAVSSVAHIVSELIAAPKASGSDAPATRLSGHLPQHASVPAEPSHPCGPAGSMR